MDLEPGRLGAGATVIAALVAAWAMLRGKNKSTPAETQEQINAGFKEFMHQSTERIGELEKRERGLMQYIQLLVGILRSNGIQVPRADVVVEGFLLLPPTDPAPPSASEHN